MGWVTILGEEIGESYIEQVGGGGGHVVVDVDWGTLEEITVVN